MLVLTRKPGEKIIVGNSYQIEIVAAEHGVVTLALYVDQPLTLMPGNVHIDAGLPAPGEPLRAIRLSRKVDDSVLIGEDIDRLVEVLVVSVKGEAVRIGVKAPREMQVHRQEVFEMIEQANIAAAQAPVVNTTQLQQLLGKRTCPACKREMPPRTAKCPHCGAPRAK
jgi:carbon storage regulator